MKKRKPARDHPRAVGRLNMKEREETESSSNSNPPFCTLSLMLPQDWSSIAMRMRGVSGCNRAMELLTGKSEGLAPNPPQTWDVYSEERQRKRYWGDRREGVPPCVADL